MAILAIAFNFLYNIFKEKMYFKAILENKDIIGLCLYFNLK